MKKNLKIFTIVCSFVLCFTLILAPGCNAQTSEKKSNNFTAPNQEALNAKVVDQYKDLCDDLTKDSLNEFINGISKVSRISGHCEKIREYIVNWANKNGFTPIVDACGSVYFDVPATSGYENAPKVILQSHMDMVCTTLDREIKPESMIPDLVYDEKEQTVHSRNYQTNTGADDAEGMIAMMAIAKNKSLKHGAIRMLFTYDEETEQDGAKNLSPQVLDTDYLINIDCGPVATMCVSSAGILKVKISKQYNPVVVNNKIAIDVEINKLLGGHSGIDITHNRVNANAAICKMLMELTDQKVEFNIAKIQGGNAANAIASSASVTIFINPSEYDKVNKILSSKFDEIRKDTEDENTGVLEINKKNDIEPKALSLNDSNDIAASFSTMPHGVRKMNDKFDDMPAVSSNFATIKTDNFNVEVVIHSRSDDEEEHVKLDARFKELSKQYNDKYEVLNWYAGWPYNEDQRLSELMAKSYKETSGLEAKPFVTHGGLEASRFLEIKPSMKMIGIGMDNADEHSTKESLYVKSMPAFFASLVYCLEHINEL